MISPEVIPDNRRLEGGPPRGEYGARATACPPAGRRPVTRGSRLVEILTLQAGEIAEVNLGPSSSKPAACTPRLLRRQLLDVPSPPEEAASRICVIREHGASIA